LSFSRRTLHIGVYLGLFLVLRAILTSGEGYVAAISKDAFLETEFIFVLGSCGLMLFNLPSYLASLIAKALEFVFPQDTCVHDVFVILPYGSVLLATSPKAFWSRWSRPAMTVIRRIIYYPVIKLTERFYVAIPVLFFFNALSHYSVSELLVGDKAASAWNTVFGVLGGAALLTSFTDIMIRQYMENQTSQTNLPTGMAEPVASSDMEKPIQYRLFTFAMHHGSILIALYAVVHKILKLGLEDLV